MMSLTLAIEARGSGIGKAWDVSPSLQPNSHRLSWPHSEVSPLEVRTISGVGRLPQQFKDDFGTKTKSEDTDWNNQPRNEINFARQERKLGPFFQTLDSSNLEDYLSNEDKLEYSIFTEAGNFCFCIYSIFCNESIELLNVTSRKKLRLKVNT